VNAGRRSAGMKRQTFIFRAISLRMPCTKTLHSVPVTGVGAVERQLYPAIGGGAFKPLSRVEHDSRREIGAAPLVNTLDSGPPQRTRRPRSCSAARWAGCRRGEGVAAAVKNQSRSLYEIR
jgi:hypothetical protein